MTDDTVQITKSIGLGLVVLVILGSLAGCLTREESDPGDTTDLTITARETSCNSGDPDPASVESRAGYYRIAGSLSIPNPCHTLDVSTSRKKDTLTLTLETTGNSGACVMCLGRMDYELKVRTTADRVRIRHNNRVLLKESLDKNNP